MVCLPSPWVSIAHLIAVSPLIRALEEHWPTRVWQEHSHVVLCLKLRDVLIRAKVSLQRRSKRKPTGFKKCHKSGGACMMCLHSTDAAQTHKCSKTGKLWKIKSPIDCCSKNVIYKLSCKRCPQLIYVGETSRMAKDRFYQHRSNILTKTKKHRPGVILILQVTKSPTWLCSPLRGWDLPTVQISANVARNIGLTVIQAVLQAKIKLTLPEELTWIRNLHMLIAVEIFF